MFHIILMRDQEGTMMLLYSEAIYMQGILQWIGKTQIVHAVSQCQLIQIVHDVRCKLLQHSFVDHCAASPIFAL